MNEREKIRMTHLTLLISYTLLSCVMIAGTLMMDWDKSGIVLLLIGMLASWILHITETMAAELRTVFYVVMWALAFFLYGIHATSLFTLAPLMLLFMLVCSATDRGSLIIVCLVTYFITIGYDILFVVGTMLTMNLLTVTRMVLHALFVCMGAYIIHVNQHHRQLERQRAKELIEQYRDMMERTENFLANVSHELRTPINVVTGITSVLQKKDLEPQLSHDIQAVNEAGMRLFGQIEDILDFTEIDTGRIRVTEEPYMITSIVNDLMAGQQLPESGKKLEILLDVDAKLPAVLLGDGRKIKKILRHLIGNATKFTRCGGVYVHIYGVPKGYGINLCIEVNDTGIGIAKEQLTQITERFYQSSKGRNRKAGGLGLGLSLVHGMVVSMGGFLQIHSTEGEGTQVQVSIPQKIEDATPCMVVENRDRLCLACFLRTEKYEQPKLRLFYNEMISHMVGGLDLTLHRVSELEEVKQLASAYQLTHLFIGREEYEESPEYFEQLDWNIKVVVIAETHFSLPADSRAILLRKPFYGLPVVSVLNTSGSLTAAQMENRQMLCPKVRVLVVDDEPMNLMVAEGILGNYKMQVEMAESGAQALRICEKNDFDLILLDHMMPEMDGVETLRRIRAMLARTGRSSTIVAFTANAVSGAREMFAHEGFDEFLAKPLETLELERVLRKLLPDSKICYADEQEFVNDTVQGTAEASGKDSWLQQLERGGVDVSAGVRYSNGEMEFYRKVLERFAAGADENAALLESYYEAQDIANYQIKVHALKSTSKMIGAESFSDRAKRAEQAAKEQDLDYLQAHHEQLLADYRQLAAVVYDAVGVQEDQQEQAAEALSEAELVEQLKQLADALQTCEADRAESILDAVVAAMREDAALCETLRGVKHDIDDFEMTAAEQKIRQLISDRKDGEQ